MPLPHSEIFDTIKMWAVQIVSLILFLVWLFRAAWKEITAGKSKKSEPTIVDNSAPKA